MSGAPDHLREDEAGLWRELAVCRLLGSEPIRGFDALERALTSAADGAPIERVRILARVLPYAINPVHQYVDRGRGGGSTGWATCA